MPDLSSLLHDEIAEEMEDVIVPEGYWKGTIRAGRLNEKDRDGLALTDKNGDEYAIAKIYVQCDEPIDGVDQQAAEKYFNANGPRETMATYTEFVRGRRDVRALTNKLAKCGALTSGRPLAKVLDELKGSGVPVQVLIEHEEWNDRPQANVTEMIAV